MFATDQQVYDTIVLPNSLQGAAFAHGSAPFSSFCLGMKIFHEHSCRVSTVLVQML